MAPIDLRDSAALAVAVVSLVSWTKLAWIVVEEDY